jgi:hypothetical protein
MKTILTALLVASLSITAACGKKQSAENCNDVVDHVASMNDMLKEKINKDRDKAIAKCEKAPISARQCMLDAKEMSDLMACDK